MAKIYTLPFNKINLRSRVKAGGKGAALGEMLRANIPVPPGFVILTNGLEDSLKGNQEIANLINKLNIGDFKDHNKIESFSKKTRSLIEKIKIPQNVSFAIKNEFTNVFKTKGTLTAVRSSAVSEDSSEASWAGELESYLNVNFNDLLTYVKKCWSSIFTSRALYYRYENSAGFDNFEVAVVVQKMIQSEKSGVCFTVNPVNKKRNELTIEAAYGLGEAVVLGHVTPDRYIVEILHDAILEIEANDQSKMLILNKKSTNKWIKVPKNISYKQKLSGREIIELYKICKKVENHFRFPCDIEWAYEKGKFYIVQSRPITTLI